MKKAIAILLVLAMVFAFAACSSSKDSGNNPANSDNVVTSSPRCR